MKHYLLKTWLMLVCLIVGVGTTWAETITLDYSKCSSVLGSGTGATYSSTDWTYADLTWGRSNAYANNQGIQIKAGASNCIWNISEIPGDITNITVTMKTNGATLTYGTSAKPATNSKSITGTTAVSTDISTSGIRYFKIAATSSYCVVSSIVVTYSSGSTKTLSSIEVKTAPSKTSYTEGQNFDPSGLVITADYGADGKEDVAYTSNESKFSFSPTLTTALTTSNNKVSITYGGKTAEQSITVNAIPSHTATFYANGEVFVTPATVKEAAPITFPANKPADIDDKKFVGWAEATISGTTNTAPIFVTSATMGTNDKDFYAVFATASAGETEPTTYTAGQTGDYVLAVYNAPKWYALPNNPTISSGKISGDEITVSTSASSVNYVTASNANGYTWTIANATNGQTISDGTKYIYHSNGGASGTNLAYGNSTSYTWKIESETNGLTFIGMSGSTVNTRGMLANGATFGGYALSNEDASGYNRIQVLPISGSITYTDYCTTVSTKTLSSIAVKTAPTKGVYTEDEMFDPAGLVITATYDDESTEDVAYATNASAFTFSPSLTTALTPADESVTITYKEKTCTQTITVNAIPTYTLTITQPAEGGTLTVKNGDVALESGASVRVGTKLTCEVTDIPEGKRHSRFYAKWGEEDGQSKYKGTNPATFDNIATENITACEIYVTYKDIQYYTINYMINGVNTDPQENVEEKTALTFPTAPATIGGKYFIGWVENEIDEPVAEEPSLVNTSEQTATANKTYYAVYAAQGEGGAATYTKATSLAVGDKVVLGLGEVDGTPEQAVTGSDSSGATISSTANDWMIFTAVEYPEKGVVLKNIYDNYVKAGSSKFELSADNPSTISTNANSEVLGYAFVLAQNGANNRFYSNPSANNYPIFKMWKVEGGVSYSDYTTFVGYTRNVTNGNLGTVCVPCDVPAEGIKGAKFYSIAGKRVDSEGLPTSVVFEEVDELEAGVPYIFLAEADAITLSYTGNAVATAGNAGGLYGTFENIDFADDMTDYEAHTYYIINKTKIQKASSKSGVDANRAFIKMDEVAKYVGGASNRMLVVGQNGFDFEEGTLTSINAVETVTPSAIYDLQGRRVVNAQNGMYIVNGKKVIR